MNIKLLKKLMLDRAIAGWSTKLSVNEKRWKRRNLLHDARMEIKRGLWSDKREFRNISRNCQNFNRSMRKHLETEKYPLGYNLNR